MERLEQNISNIEWNKYWERSTDLNLDAQRSTDLKKIFDAHFEGVVMKWTVWFWTKKIDLSKINWENGTNDSWKQLLSSQLWGEVIWLQTITKDKSVFKYTGDKWTLVFLFAHLNQSWDVSLRSSAFYSKGYVITEENVWWTTVDVMRTSEWDKTSLPTPVVEAVKAL